MLILGRVVKGSHTISNLETYITILDHIGPIIQCVLDLFDINVENLPSKSTAAILTSKMGVVSRNHINEEMKNNCKITMHRDATTKKGETFLWGSIQYW